MSASMHFMILLLLNSLCFVISTGLAYLNLAYDQVFLLMPQSLIFCWMFVFLLNISSAYISKQHVNKSAMLITTFHKVCFVITCICNFIFLYTVYLIYCSY